MKKLSRRQVLRLSGVAAGAVIFGQGCAPQAPASTPTSTIAPPPPVSIDLTNRYIAYCGLDCAGLCSQYGSSTCSKGCLGDTCARYCLKCPTRTCSREHNVANCALCEAYPCQKLQAQYTSLEKGGYAAWAESARAVLEEVHQSRQ